MPVELLVDAGSALPGGVSAEDFERWLGALRTRLRGVAPDAAISVRVVGAEVSRELNREYRGKDKPTNVLSFAGDDGPAGVLLGDLAICEDVVRGEALEQGKSEAAHLAHLFVHGTLHLLGYDHEIESDAERMESLEVDVLRDLGIRNPYLPCNRP